MSTKQFVFFVIFLSLVLVDTTYSEDNPTRKFFAVQEMVSMVQKKDQILFSVLLLRYFIEGREYSASAVTVGPDHTYDIVQTKDGFEAFALFRKSLVHEEARRNEFNKDLVKVRLKVLLDDIFGIIGHKKSGEQIKLYME